MDAAPYRELDRIDGRSQGVHTRIDDLSQGSGVKGGCFASHGELTEDGVGVDTSCVPSAGDLDITYSEAIGGATFCNPVPVYCDSVGSRSPLSGADIRLQATDDLHGLSHRQVSATYVVAENKNRSKL